MNQSRINRKFERLTGIYNARQENEYYLPLPQTHTTMSEYNLTKEAFWDPPKERYLKAMNIFGDWIDEYKKRVEWHGLFATSEYEHANNESVKFHDLPDAMQIGIWIQFAKEIAQPHTEHEWKIDNLFQYEWAKAIIGTLVVIENSF